MGLTEQKRLFASILFKSNQAYARVSCSFPVAGFFGFGGGPLAVDIEAAF